MRKISSIPFAIFQFVDLRNVLSTSFQNAVWSPVDKDLRLLPYNEKLTLFTKDVCSEFVGERENETCNFEVRVVFDCMIRAKERKYGRDLSA